MFDVYIANLGKYNEGELVGGWLSLPATKEEWESLLVKIKLGHYEDGEFHYGYEENGIIYEEWAIHDTNIEYDIHVEEYSNIQDLNYVAAAFENCTDPELVVEFINNYNYSASYEELINVSLQEEDIPFYLYEFPGVSNCNFMDKEEKLGYTIAYMNGTLDVLQSYNFESYFDFEAYARDYITGGNLVLLENGYIDIEAVDIDLFYYTYEEIEEEFEEYKLW